MLQINLDVNLLDHETLEATASFLTQLAGMKFERTNKIKNHIGLAPEDTRPHFSCRVDESQESEKHNETSAQSLQTFIEKAAPGKNSIDRNQKPEQIITTDNLIQTDSEGRTWDARIHSSSKAFDKNGAWKLRRGVSPELVHKVRDVIPAALNNKIEPQNTPILQAASTDNSQPPVLGVDPYIQIMRRITTAINLGRLTTERINFLAQSCGLQGIPNLSLRRDLIPKLNDELDKEGI